MTHLWIKRPALALKVVAVARDDIAAGSVARAMLVEDSRWIADAFLSARINSGWISLLLLGHGTRIAYEGAVTLGSENPNVGVPEVARSLEKQHYDVIARSRHGGSF